MKNYIETASEFFSKFLFLPETKSNCDSIQVFIMTEDRLHYMPELFIDGFTL